MHSLAQSIEREQIGDMGKRTAVLFVYFSNTCLFAFFSNSAFSLLHISLCLFYSLICGIWSQQTVLSGARWTSCLQQAVVCRILPPVLLLPLTHLVSSVWSRGWWAFKKHKAHRWFWDGAAGLVQRYRRTWCSECTPIKSRKPRFSNSPLSDNWTGGMPVKHL